MPSLQYQDITRGDIVETKTETVYKVVSVWKSKTVKEIAVRSVGYHQDAFTTIRVGDIKNLWKPYDKLTRQRKTK